jgi:hypothetical protein
VGIQFFSGAAENECFLSRRSGLKHFSCSDMSPVFAEQSTGIYSAMLELKRGTLSVSKSSTQLFASSLSAFWFGNKRKRPCLLRLYYTSRLTCDADATPNRFLESFF